MSPNEARKVFKERKLRESKWGTEDILKESNLTLKTDYDEPFELATVIMGKYNEFVKQQLRIESEKTGNHDILR